MIYVTSDIHGESFMLIKMLNYINFTDEDHLYILGDVIDRGKDSINLLKWIMNTPNMTLLRGNHEQMMINAIREEDLSLWFYNGGDKTYDEYINLSSQDQDNIMSYLNSLPKFIKLNMNETILCHAGVKFEDEVLAKYQDGNFCIWAREEFYKYTEVPNKYKVIFGHTPSKYLHGEWKIWHDNNKICIDCGATYGGKLACLRLNDMKEFYI